jgi:hypothetical protein
LECKKKKTQWKTRSRRVPCINVSIAERSWADENDESRPVPNIGVASDITGFVHFGNDSGNDNGSRRDVSADTFGQANLESLIRVLFPIRFDTGVRKRISCRFVWESNESAGQEGGSQTIVTKSSRSLGLSVFLTHSL